MREHGVELLLEVTPIVEPRKAVGLRHIAQPLVRLEQLSLPFLELLLETLYAKHRANARLELGKLDRLRYIVVRPCLETFDLILCGAEGGLHDDRTEGQ